MGISGTIDESPDRFELAGIRFTHEFVAPSNDTRIITRAPVTDVERVSL